MTAADELRALFEALGCRVEQSKIQDAERLEVHQGPGKAIIDVFNTGTLRPGGKEGPVLDFVRETLGKYQSDANFLRTTLGRAPAPEASGRSVNYSSALLALDSSRHGDAFSAVERAGHANLVDGKLASDEVAVWAERDRVVVEGAADKVDAVIAVLVRFGARVEESVSTPFKDRIPKLAARWSSSTAEQAEMRTKELLGRELFDFLPAHDRRAIVSAVLVLDTELPVQDMAPIVMPIARAFEGFVGKMLVKIGVVTDVAIQDPTFSFSACFDGRDAKAFKAKVNTHEAMLDALKQRLKEHRHTRAHSQASKWVQGDRAAAERFLSRVADDMKEYFAYFKQHFAT
jgi:hypothetical protein